MARRALPYILFAILAAILLWPLATGKVLLPADMLGRMEPWRGTSAGGSADVHWNALTWDGIAYFYPARHFLGKSLRSGELPMWNPHQMCGMPVLASPQSAVLYPPNWLFAVLPTDITFGLLAFLHLFAAGSFTYIFLRKLGLGVAAGAFGGVAFMLSGWTVTWLQLPVLLSSGVWLPLTLLLITDAWERRSMCHAALAGATIALSLFGGHPQIWAYLLLTALLYWIFVALAGREIVPLTRSAVMAALTFGVGLLLAAPQLLPTIELSSLSHRGGSAPTIDGYAAYSALAMPFRNLIGTLVPDFYGNPIRGNYWGAGEYSEYCAYVGILPLLLLPFAFVGRGRRNASFFSGLAVLALLMALGTGVNRALYFGVPGFSSSGSPARMLFVFTFGVAVLGSIGMDRLLAMKSKAGVRAVLLSASGVAAAGMVLFCANSAYVARLASVSPLDLLAAAYVPILTAVVSFAVCVAVLLLVASGRAGVRLSGGMLVCLLSIDLLIFGIGYNRFSNRSDVYPEPGLIRDIKGYGLSRVLPMNDEWRLRSFPKAVFPPNAATVYGFYDVQGYDSLYPVRYKHLLDAAAGRDSSPPENGNMIFGRDADSPLWDRLGVGCFITNDGSLVPNRSADDRAFVVHRTLRASDGDTLRMLAGRNAPPEGTAIVQDGLFLDGSSVRDAARITGYGANTVTVVVDDAKSPGLLVLTDQFYPGWTALVNGKGAELHQVDYCFRGVEVPTGRSTVRFSFEPRSFRYGLYLAGLGGLIMIGLLVRERFGGHRA